MTHKLNEKVSVNLVYNHEKGKVFPKWLSWKGRLYAVEKIGLHHSFKEGSKLYHVFSVETKTLFFRLLFDTETLHWKVEEIEDS